MLSVVQGGDLSRWSTRTAERALLWAVSRDRGAAETDPERAQEARHQRELLRAMLHCASLSRKLEAWTRDAYLRKARLGAAALQEDLAEREAALRELAALGWPGEHALERLRALELARALDREPAARLAWERRLDDPAAGALYELASCAAAAAQAAPAVLAWAVPLLLSRHELLWTLPAALLQRLSCASLPFAAQHLSHLVLCAQGRLALYGDVATAVDPLRGFCAAGPQLRNLCDRVLGRAESPSARALFVALRCLP